jgi:metal-responsive CopG/Arc/MetJ family transcriptional regulator
MVNEKENGNFTINFSKKLRSVLDIYVEKKKNTSVSKVIRIALFEYLKKEGVDIELIDFF